MSEIYPSPATVPTSDRIWLAGMALRCFIPIDPSQFHTGPLRTDVLVARAAVMVADAVLREIQEKPLG